MANTFIFLTNKNKLNNLFGGYDEDRPHVEALNQRLSNFCAHEHHYLMCSLTDQPQSFSSLTSLNPKNSYALLINDSLSDKNQINDLVSQLTSYQGSSSTIFLVHHLHVNEGLREALKKIVTSSHQAEGRHEAEESYKRSIALCAANFVLASGKEEDFNKVAEETISLIRPQLDAALAILTRLLLPEHKNTIKDIDQKMLSMQALATDPETATLALNEEASWAAWKSISDSTAAEFSDKDYIAVLKTFSEAALTEALS